MSKTANDTLDTFEGWENATDIDFFGEAPEEVKDEATKLLEEVEKADIETTVEDKKKKTDPKADETKKGDEPEIDFFGDAGEEDDTKTKSKASTDDNDEEDDTPVALSDKAVLTYLKSKNLANFELNEGEELTDELASELLEDSYEDAVEERVKSLMKDLPDTLKNFVKLATSGGDVNELISKMAISPTTKITKDLDLEDEKNQILVIKTLKATEGEDEDTTDTYIEFLKDSGKLKGVSEKSKDKIVAANAKQVADEAERTRQNKLAQKERQRQFKAELSEFIDTKDEIASMGINKVDKRNLPSYIADRNVKLEDGRVTTAMQKDLFNVLQDKDKTVILAKLLKNNFDFSEIIKAEKTKYTKEVKQGLSRSKSASSNTTKGSSHSGKGQLADYF